ncbi:MAG: hypothetical protein KGM46_04855 [Pseudomonadota bacterium]|nr:hypothetical protein [Xanthomonadaceae bacterium]MDE2249504.1 hypothetical protein [Xanthomonadaceae bacterium]MDE3210050.1 hypothetical protein [Pseudomonadota bacterium]
MNLRHAGRLIRASLLLAAALALAGCGFHLRRNASLPPSMQRIHVNAPTNALLQRHLARALESSGVTVEDSRGPGIAELNVPVAAFNTQTLTGGGYVRVSEFAVHYQVKFGVSDADGRVLVPLQSINMSREFSYDATNTVGNASQIDEIQQSLNADMIQAILLRLEAAGRHGLAAPAPATRTH